MQPSSFSATSRLRARLDQQMLGAEDLGGLGQHGGAADLGQQVRAVAEGGVGGDAGEGIRAAAIEAEDDLGSGASERAARRRPVRRSVRSRGARLRSVPVVPPLPCSVMPTRRLVRGAVRAQVVIDLVDLAAQAEDEGGRDIGMHQHAAEGAPQLIHIGAEGVAAAFAVREGDHAIDIGRQCLAFVAARDQFRGVRGAVAGGHDGDVVARADAAVLALVAEEGGGIGARTGDRDFRGGEFVVEDQFLEGEVVGVDVAAGIDGHLGAADHLAVALHGFAGGDVPERDFVAGGNGVAGQQRAGRRRAVRCRREAARARWRRCRWGAGGWRNSRRWGLW